MRPCWLTSVTSPCNCQEMVELGSGVDARHRLHGTVDEMLCKVWCIDSLITPSSCEPSLPFCPLWGQGVALILFKTFIIIMGLQLLRYAAIMESRRKWRREQCASMRCEALPLRSLSNGASPRFRLLGLSMAMAVGPLCEVSAYAFAPQPLCRKSDRWLSVYEALVTSVGGPHHGIIRSGKASHICPGLRGRFWLHWMASMSFGIFCLEPGLAGYCSFGLGV